jgi:VanZ family protein
MFQAERMRFRAARVLLAIAASAALVLAAPFIGEIRRAILQRFPGQFVQIVGAIVLFAVAAAVVAAVARIRDRRGLRYAAIATALGIAGMYALATRTGDPQVDAVERFHFVEYGLITFLFYRAVRPAADASALVLPVLAGLFVGTIEEWFQWFIPARVGDVRDVFLNGVAIGCGLLFSVAVEPPLGSPVRLTATGARRIGISAAAAVIAFAAFFDSVHLGYAIPGEGCMFRSCFTAAALQAHGDDRAERWRGTFIERPRRLSAEDQYMTEGLWHVQRRNRAWDAGDVTAAWHENEILEDYFTPVLDTPSYVSRTGHRWSAGHRAEAERRFREAGADTPYQSDAHPSAIHTWPKRIYWSVVALLVVLLAVPAALPRGRTPAIAPAASSS